MCFLKITSDSGKGRAVAAEMLTDLVERNIDRILGQIDWLRQPFPVRQTATAGAGCYAETGDGGWQEDCARLCMELHCSQTMRIAVEQCVRYWTLAGVDYQKILGQMRADALLPCRDKREGKRRFEELKRQLL